ncbi:hypothetical protein JOD69_003722 [Methylocaldum sp. RMAD-M]|jgi:hypothetical protein|nr:hypothetical protein [Methylocaldum sp. RMAD-M]
MGTKSLISSALILIVKFIFGLTQNWWALLVLPVAFLTGIYFGAIALVITSFARSYDFFVYYIILGITLMVLLSGFFFLSPCCRNRFNSRVPGFPFNTLLRLYDRCYPGEFLQTF